MPFKGSCLCGRVEYEIRQLDMPIGHFHCATCRKAHASAYTTTAGVLRSHFKITRGTDDLNGFESSPGKFRRFCRHCGTHVFAERPAQPHIILRLATLDEDPGERPAFHIWTSHDVDWLKPECPSYPEWQPGR
ncbi:GFA family protein [Ancylobacter pratisalsi]|uniref:GFA family protein n=1 Tax=Ancylobacter pratisalsi TaxID=1745854 RepID=A0A6P1YJE9_9HYPH|nr:GFA family protein [Ancylobacter pratisalsi]QIB32801.1 GFA family protein [Ancylobacter pratisalsi]